MTVFLQIVIGGLLQGGVFASVALGFSLVYRITGVINLSQGAFCILGAMGMYYCAQGFGWPVLLAVPVAAVAATVFSVLIGATTFVPAVTRLPVSSTLVLTAGLLTFFEGVTLRRMGQSALQLAAVFRRGADCSWGSAHTHPGIVARRRLRRDNHRPLVSCSIARASATPCGLAPRIRWRRG